MNLIIINQKLIEIINSKTSKLHEILYNSYGNSIHEHKVVIEYDYSSTKVKRFQNVLTEIALSGPDSKA